MNNLLSAADLPLRTGGFTGSKTATTGLLAAPGTGIEIFVKFISSAIGLLTIVAIIWFVFTLLMGAIGWISSGGDKNALESAKKKIASGVTGLVIIIAALFIVNLIALLLGLGNILDLTKMFNSLTPAP